MELYGSARLYSYNQFSRWLDRTEDWAVPALYTPTVNIWSGKVLKTSSDPGDLSEKQEIKS